MPVTSGQEQLGAAWPFTVPYGAVSCEVWGPLQERGPVVVFAAPDGTLYGLNEKAQSMLNLPPVDGIWRLGPDGQRVSLSPIIDRGLELCA